MIFRNPYEQLPCRYPRCVLKRFANIQIHLQIEDQGSRQFFGLNRFRLKPSTIAKGRGRAQARNATKLAGARADRSVKADGY
jgi:hypothetical protein